MTYMRIHNGRLVGVGLGIAAGAVVAALAGSPLASADESPAAGGDSSCTSDLCGTIIGPYQPYFPFEYEHEYVPAGDYASEGFFYYPPGSDVGFPDASGFDIVSGETDRIPEFPGVEGETVLYTVDDGVVSSPIELLPFEAAL